MVYYSIDTYTVMVYNRNIAYILDKLGCRDEYLDECFNRRIEEKWREDRFFPLEFNGITIAIYPGTKSILFESVPTFIDEKGQQHYKSIPIDKDGNFIDLITVDFDKIRVNISGTGLSYLRYRYNHNLSNLDPEIDFHDELFWGKQIDDYRVSRCDFAFDYVNYLPDTVDELRKFAYNWQYNTTKTRLHTTNKGGCTWKDGYSSTSKCMYLGSHKSDTMLRLYDKLIEQQVKQKTKLIEFPEIFLANEKEEIKSWIRIELQTRDDYSMYLLFQPKSVTDYLNQRQKKALPYPTEFDDYSYILRFVLDKYVILDSDDNIPEFIKKLCDWEALPQLIRNTSFIYKRLIDRVENNLFTRYAKQTIAYIANFGFNNYENRIKEIFYDIQCDMTPVGRMRYNAVMQAIDLIASETGRKKEDLFITFDINKGLYIFKE